MMAESTHYAKKFTESKISKNIICIPGNAGTLSKIIEM